ncbi:MAG: hypothetical protein ABW119_23030, partial [Candidatus Thiodiazotropha lotti]
MASEQKGSGRGKQINSKLVLRGLNKGDERPQVEITLIDRQGKVFESVPIAEDGAFDLPLNTIEKAHRIRIGPAVEASDDEAPAAVFLNYRIGDFVARLERGVLDVSRGVWREWLFRYRCVSGSGRLTAPANCRYHQGEGRHRRTLSHTGDRFRLKRLANSLQPTA